MTDIHSHLLRTTALSCLLTLALTACIRPEAPNAEADILDVAVEGLDPLEAPPITNNSVRIFAEPWQDRTSVALSFTLTPGATIRPASGSRQDFTSPVVYTVTSEDGQWTKDYTITIASPRPAPTHFDFEEVKRYVDEEGKSYYDQFVYSEDEVWGSPNHGYVLLMPDPSDASGYPVTQSKEGMSGSCVRLTTLSTGPLGAMFGSPIAPGTLFLGDFDFSQALASPLKATRFGVPEWRKPLMITGYYKYSAGEMMTDRKMEEIPDRRDLFDLYALLFEADEEVNYLDGTTIQDSSRIVLRAQIKDAKESDEWVRFELPFEPVEGRVVDEQKLSEGKYRLTIVMTSSKGGATFEGAVGSTLLVDEIDLYFE